MFASFFSPPLSLSHARIRRAAPATTTLLLLLPIYFPHPKPSHLSSFLPPRRPLPLLLLPPPSSMGFPSVCYTVILPRPVAFVVHLLDRIKLAVSMALFYLGLASSYDDPYFVYPLHLPDLPSAAVKSRLPVVRFSAHARAAAAEAPVCAVCLGALEARHEVRELGNCAHAFHKPCIDKWVDIGQLTCPLCRAQLLPRSPSPQSAAADDDDEPSLAARPPENRTVGRF